MMVVMYEEAAMSFFMNLHVYISMRSVKLNSIACVIAH